MSDLIKVCLVASGNNLKDDMPFLDGIKDAIYKNDAVLVRDWLGAAAARKKATPDVEKADWVNIVDESIEAIKSSDIVVAEVPLSDFNQGIQTYLAMQYKKPTLVVSRNPLEDHMLTDLIGSYLQLKHYTTIEELQEAVANFIKQNIIPEKDLRFNMVLNRRIYRYLRDTSYITGKNKSQIVRDLLERDQENRNK